MAHSRNAQKWRVYRNSKLVPGLQPLRIEESSGGGKMDYAELIFDPAVAPRMQDFNPLRELGGDIEIEAVGGGVKHVGIISQVIPTFNQQGETFKVVSQARPHLFGRPAGGVIMFNPNFPPAPDWNPDGEPQQPVGQFKLVDDDVIFNPEIDGAIFGNMHSSKRYGNRQIPVFLDPESVKTKAGKKLHQGNAIRWTLSSAVYYLCWTMNPFQSVFKNPTIQQLTLSFRDSVDFVRNVKIEDGQYLPEVLDALITPLGYRWRIWKRARGNHTLEFSSRSTGGELVWLNHQRFGEVFDPKKTNLEQQGVVFDSGRLVNRIIGRGSKLQIEITAELVKAWDPEYDEWSRSDIQEVIYSGDTEDHPGIEDAWRKWTLNEAGDYIGLRPEIKTEFPPGVKERLKAAGFLQWMIPRRRKLLPTLTRNEQGEPIGGRTTGITLEWRDSPNDEWLPVTWGFDLLNMEAGIFLNSTEIPETIRDAAEPSIRVTATIETDFRITAVAERTASSPLAEDVTAMLDLDTMFHWKEVTTLSQYHSGGYDSIAEDDREQLAAFTAAMRDRWDNADVAGAVTLEGVDQANYRVGDRVAGVKGKNISYRSRPDGTTFPQIAAITYDIEGQKTILQLERVRETVVI